LPLLPLLPRQWLLLLVCCMWMVLREASWRCIPLLWRACSLLLLLLAVVRRWLLVLVLVVRCRRLARSLALLVGGRRILLLVGLPGWTLLVLLLASRSLLPWLLLASRSLLPWLLQVLVRLIAVLSWPLLRLRRQRCTTPLRLRRSLLEARGPSACAGLLLLDVVGRPCRAEQCRPELSRSQLEQTPQVQENATRQQHGQLARQQAWAAGSGGLPDAQRGRGWGSGEGEA
jgi:hypothetical protein